MLTVWSRTKFCHFGKDLMMCLWTVQGCRQNTLLTVVSMMAMWESSQWLQKSIVQGTGKEKKLEETLDKCTDHHKSVENEC